MDFIAIEERFAKNSYILKSCLIVHQGTSILLINLSPTAKARDRKDVEKSLRKTLGSVNKELTAEQAIKFLVITHAVWTVESGLLEKDQSLKRVALEEKYKALLDKAIAGNERILW